MPARGLRAAPASGPHPSGGERRGQAVPRTGAPGPALQCRAERDPEGPTLKPEIHPEYVESHVRCTCGAEFTTRSTKPEIKVEICSNCHPFYTGKQKLVDSGGRVERFQRKLARRQKTSA